MAHGENRSAGVERQSAETVKPRAAFGGPGLKASSVREKLRDMERNQPPLMYGITKWAWVPIAPGCRAGSSH